MSADTQVDTIKNYIAEPDNFINGFPHTVFDELRKESPISWSEWSGGTGFWSLTNYEDIGFVGSNPKIFSSATENGGHRIFEEQLAGVASTGINNDTVVGAPFISRDAPLQADQRVPVMRSVSSTRLADMKDRIRQRVIKLLDTAMASEKVELVEQVSATIPIKTLAELMDIPESMEDKLYEWTNALIGEDDPEFRRSPAYMANIAKEISEYFLGLRAQRIGSDRADVVTMLSTDRNGIAVPAEDFVANIFLVLVGGNETTRNSITGGILGFTQFPEQWDLLKKSPELLPNAVNEIVRWVSPVMHMRRTLLENYTLNGVAMKKGDKVLLWYPSANRDESVWENPHAFDIGRPIIKHRAFGAGAHICVGSRLAELQISIFLEELLNRCESFELDGTVSRIRSNFICGIKSLPLAMQWKTSRG